MTDLMTLAADPTVWAALTTLVVMEVVLGIDNLIFISILSNKLPEEQRQKARRIGISLALIMRLALLSTISWLVTLTAPLFSALGRDVSWRDIILIVGGLFLLWKATKEINHTVNPAKSHDLVDTKAQVATNFGSVIIQILLIDIVFSVDSILTAIGMTDHLPIMVIAVVTAVIVMLVAADPLANFINKNPTVVMLALGFLIMIGIVLVADGLGHKVPKGYIYTAMAFSAMVEGLNMMSRRAEAKKQALKDQGA